MNRILKPRSKQQGVVIIVALFIVALVATMAYLMMERLERDTHRTSMIMQYAQAEGYAQGSVAWAMDVLNNDWEKQRPDQVIDRMPMVSPVNTVDNYQVTSSIEDMQGRYNLNNLKDDESQKDFIRLLMALLPKMTNEDATGIVAAIADWIAPTNSQNALSKYYQSLPQPYRAAHRPMVTPTELLKVKGVTPEVYAALSPYVTALPETTLINVQTAPAALYLTLSPAVTLQNATAIAQSVAAAMPASVQAFKGLDVVANLNLPDAKVTVSSSYFLVKTDVAIEKQHLLIYTLLQRAATPGKSRVSILWQSIGTW